ncbi:MAG: glycosyltransferase family 4 protein [Acidobacteria bacterium]|nr:glycosyltransferase family 4 protein [Candidatus Sulfomarinibacter kjeldsenii]
MQSETERIRVLLAITRLELGGAQRVVLHTARKLDRTVFDVALAWGPGDLLDDEAAAISELERIPVPTLVRPVAPISDLRALSSLRAAMRSFRPDVVHTHSSKAGILGRFAARLVGVPAVHTVHGFGFTPLQAAPMRFLYRTAERTMARFTDHFVTVSETDRLRGIELGIFPPEKATVIMAGVDLERFRAAKDGDAVRERLGVPVGPPVVTQVGNFKPQKAPLDFVRVAAEVQKQHPDCWFVMVGDGPLRETAEGLAHELGVEDRMVFPGWWSDVPGLLAATTVSVLTSRHEGLPCSVVESLAAGVPVVAIGRLLADPGLRDQMAVAARDGLEDFDRDLMVRQQEDLYRWMCSHSRS